MGTHGFAEGERLFLPVQKDDFDVNVFPVLVEEVLQEMRNRLVRDVAANDNVPVEEVAEKERFQKHARLIVLRSCLTSCSVVHQMPCLKWACVEKSCLI